jgi:signal transduction histidine kinase
MIAPPQPQARSALDRSSTRATRLASLGLAGVVLCLAAFSIFAAYTIRTQIDEARGHETLHESYANAILALHENEGILLKGLVLPTGENTAEGVASDLRVIQNFNRIATQGGDAPLAEDLTARYIEHRVVYARLANAAVVGNYAEIVLLQREEDSLFQGMRDLIEVAEDASEARADSAFATLQATSQWMLVLSPVVFAIGFVLMLGLWWILGRSDEARRKMYREIEQLSRLRGEFVSTVSHEFRTPLTGIEGFSEMMRDDELPVALMREYAGDINKDAQRLARLITDMLDLDRLESGLMTPTADPVDLNSIVVDAAAPFRLNEAAHPIALDLDEGLPTLRGDPDRLTQVVTNLLSNAIKYSPAGGAVEIRTRLEATAVVLTVRDHGMGIPSDQLESIFERYTRVETAGTRPIQGTGLGLPIVRQIVRLYRGRVWATSDAGDGSVFHVQLPLPDRVVSAGELKDPARPRARAA